MNRLRIILFGLLFYGGISATFAAKLAIVIDDFGYRLHNEQQVLQLPVNVSIAILPNSPYRLSMAQQAHQQGREILIHLPMAPQGRQSLEIDTLQPSMSEAEIQRIVHQAIQNVPYAVGLNNHMGSAMTSSLLGMQKVMRTLNTTPLYFLDSMTIGNSQAAQAAYGTHVNVIKRHVFLDNTQNEADIRQQLERAIQLARKQGFAIAIGHPHTATVRVLQQMLPQLPSDIVLVKPSSLLNTTPQESANHQPNSIPQTIPKNKPFSGIGICKTAHPPVAPTLKKVLDVILSSIKESWFFRRLNAL